MRYVPYNVSIELGIYRASSVVSCMSKKDKLLKAVRNNPSDVRFDDLRKICEEYFGQHTSSGTSPMSIRLRGKETLG